MAIPCICSVENCDKPVDKRGWCSGHYTRWYRHGDPLGGGVSRGEPWRFIREVAFQYRGDDCLIWPFGKDEYGYGQIGGVEKHARVHRVVCEEVHGPPPTVDHEVRHLCGKGSLGCVNPGHLAWGTRSENILDKLDHGTHNRGEQHNMVKLTEADIREIRALRGQLTQRAIAKKFNVSQQRISSIYTGATWGWLE